MKRPPWLPTFPDMPGLALAFAVGGGAVAAVRVLPKSPFVSDVLVALVGGAILSNTPLGLGTSDRFAAGLRFTGKWVLRLAIVLMGLKVQTSFFGRTELATIAIALAACVPSTFFVTHVLGALFGLRRPLVDLLAGGTMICGASAVNAIAPVARAERNEQGVAIAVVFAFSVVAMLSFRTIAFALGLDSTFAGLWSGLAVNDLASAIAVGAQMGGAGAVMAAAAKSSRILLLAPVLVSIAVARRLPDAKKPNLAKSIVDALPAFIVGYVALAIVRAVGDRVFGGAAWRSFLAGNQLVVDVLMATVAAGIGFHLDVRSVLGSSARALAVGAGASVWMAGLSVTMVTLLARGAFAAAIGVGAIAFAAALGLHRAVRNSATAQEF